MPSRLMAPTKPRAADNIYFTWPGSSPNFATLRVWTIAGSLFIPKGSILPSLAKTELPRAYCGPSRLRIYDPGTGGSPSIAKTTLAASALRMG